MDAARGHPHLPPPTAVRVLHHVTLSARDACPARWLFVLHGAFGAGRNWSSAARRLVRDRPDWGVVLVDLRLHGGSQGFPPPHTVAASASDVLALADRLSPRIEEAALLGHSFGGKVALSCVRADAGRWSCVWVIDSTPDAMPLSGSLPAMLGHLRALPGPFGTRREAEVALEARGVAPKVARWMATNLVREPELRWRFDLDALEELLMDFFRTDLWDVLEQGPPPEFEFVAADDSPVLTRDARRRIETIGERTGATHLHRVAGGHWVHVDNPRALHSLLEARLP